jgi:hypothetical protein
MSEVNPTRRANESPTRDGVPLAGWPTAITAEDAVALRMALAQLQTALDAVVRDRDEARAEVERLHRAHQAACEGGDLLRATLLAEIERQARHIEELRSKIDAEKSCCCSYDAPGDVCAAHSPALDEARAEVERLRAEMLELAEWCEAEEPLSHKKLSYRLRYAQEAKP